MTKILFWFYRGLATYYICKYWKKILTCGLNALEGRFSFLSTYCDTSAILDSLSNCNKGHPTFSNQILKWNILKYTEKISYFRFPEKNLNLDRDLNLLRYKVQVPVQVWILLLKSEILISRGTNYKFVSTYQFKMSYFLRTCSITNADGICPL